MSQEGDEQVNEYDSITAEIGNYRVSLTLDEDKDLTLWVDDKHGLKIWEDEHFPESVSGEGFGLRVHASGKCTRCGANVFYDEDSFLRTYDGEYTCESTPWVGNSEDRPAHVLHREAK
jgi:hypothetical protein